MSEAEFVAGAVALNDLSESEAREIYHDDARVATIPVVATETVQATPGVTPGSENQIAAASGACTLTTTRTHENILNWDMWRYTSKKYWESNGTRVTRWTVTVSGHTTKFGRAAGWGYVGSIDPSNGYRTYGGNAYGAHYSSRTGLWETNAPVERQSTQIQQTVRRNGTWRSVGNSVETGDCF